MRNTLTKENWIEELYQLLCKSQGAPANTNEEKNLREWAEACHANCLEAVEGNESEMDSPADAHDEELSAGA